MSVAVNQVPLKGGEFLVKDSSIESIFIPEDKNEDQSMMIQMARDFIINEIHQCFCYVDPCPYNSCVKTQF